MKYLRSTFFLFLVSIPLISYAGLRSGDLPGSAVWYLHADLAAMRASESGTPLYRWLDGEVFVEIHEELGIDIDKETDSITAYSNPETGLVVIVEGNMSGDSRNKLMELAGEENDLEERKHGGRIYYHMSGMDIEFDDEDMEGPAYFSFAVKNKLIVTSNEDQLNALLDSGGKVSGSESHDGALLVLTADKSFVQAGAKTDRFHDDDGDWDSNIIRNTEEAAVMLSDMDGMIAIEARLVAKDPQITSSIGGIVNGLISLQAFNDELDPEIRALIQNTRIDVDDKVLKVSTVIDPNVVVAVIDD